MVPMVECRPTPVNSRTGRIFGGKTKILDNARELCAMTHLGTALALTHTPSLPPSPPQPLSKHILHSEGEGEEEGERATECDRRYLVYFFFSTIACMCVV